MYATPTPTAPDLLARQVWSPPTTTQPPPHCTVYNLPANGILVLNGTSTVTLATDALFQPFCSDELPFGSNGSAPISDFQVPFVASTIPQIFVIGAMLVVSWTLVVILIITPRTSLVLGGSSGFMGNTRGSSSVISSGSRPVLQKVAALTVFISMLIATIDSLRVAYDTYSAGYEDPLALMNVEDSLELRVIRVISDTFLWLAQVQTLIRLFPRQKEKVTIKWAGFALILFDTVFSILDNFIVSIDGQYSAMKTARFRSAVAALSYLFQLALSVVYMASVLYYSIVKRRFAYYHRNMRSISVVALLSFVSVSAPVAFFVVNIALYDISGWGDYVRWVGAAAASVVVWEWVERIEALEREERKDGILGRETFDGDEMSPSRGWSNPSWPRRRKPHGDASKTRSHSPSDFSSGGSTTVNESRARLTFRSHLAAVRRPLHARRRARQLDPVAGRDEAGDTHDATVTISRVLPPTSPVSRSDNTSAASTVYAVVHHPNPSASAAFEPLVTAHVSSNGVPGNRTTPNSTTPIQPYTQPPRSVNDSTSATLAVQPSPSNSSSPRSSPQRPLRSVLTRPFRRADRATFEDSIPNVAPLPPDLFPPPSQRLPTTSASRARFRLRRVIAEPATELPLYVIRGGGHERDGLRVELQSASQQESADLSSINRFSTPAAHRISNDGSQEGVPEANSSSVQATVGREAQEPHTSSPSASQPRDRWSPDLRVQQPSPPISTLSPPPRSSDGTTESSTSLQNLQSQSLTHRSNTVSSRHSQRSPPSMPPLMEGQRDAGPSETTSSSWSGATAPSGVPDVDSREGTTIAQPPVNRAGDD